MNNTTFLVNSTLTHSLKNTSIFNKKYFIRHHDRIDTFCDSEESETAFLHFMICGLLESIIHFFGILASIGSILVLRKPDSQAPVYVFLRSLVWTDLFILSVNGFGFILPQLLDYPGLSPTFTTIIAPSIAPYFYPVVNMGYTALTYFTALLIFDRYVVLCRPFSQRRFCSVAKSYKIVLGITIFAVLINIPRFFDYGTLVTVTPQGDTIYQIIPLGLMTIRDYRKYYLFVTWFMTRFVIPWSIMLYSTGAITAHILKTFIRREMLSTTKRHEHNLGKLCIFVAVLFIICNSPTTYSRVCRGFLAMKPRPDVLYASNVLLAFNSAFKAAILCLFKQRFKTHFYQLISLPCSACLEIRGWIYGKRSDKQKITTANLALLEEEEACDKEIDEA